MRFVLYLLVIANLAYLGWNLLQDNPVAATVRQLPPLPASVKSLVTVQEFQRQNPAPTAQLQADPAAEQQSDTTPQEVEQRQDAVLLEHINSERPPGAGMPVVACQALGPFDLEDEARRYAARLDKLGLAPRQRMAEVREENGYWVYLPRMGHDQALTITRQLDAQGDHDYFIGKDNRLSLGIFQDVARAEQRLRQIRRLGLEPVLEVRYRSHQAYWLEFSDHGDSGRLLSDLLQQQPQLQLQPLACL